MGVGVITFISTIMLVLWILSNYNEPESAITITSSKGSNFHTNCFILDENHFWCVIIFALILPSKEHHASDNPMSVKRNKKSVC